MRFESLPASVSYTDAVVMAVADEYRTQTFLDLMRHLQTAAIAIIGFWLEKETEQWTLIEESIIGLTISQPGD
jgi:hypothetical protein